MLEVDDIHTYYGDSHILHGLSLAVSAQRCVAVLGRNGAGKTTTLRSILGYAPAQSGSVRFKDRDITKLDTFRIIRLGISYVPEDRGIFPSLTVNEHLRMAQSSTPKRKPLTEIYDMFPRLAERRENYGNQLSGGEQQMLAIGRALITDPDLLVLDEPSEGLAPVIIDQLEEVFHSLKNSGRTILLVEQNYQLAIGLADDVYVLAQGRCAFSGTASELEANEEIRHTHLGLH